MSVDLHLFHLPIAEFDPTQPLERQYREHAVTVQGVSMRNFRFVDPTLPLFTDPASDGTGDLLPAFALNASVQMLHWVKVIIEYQSDDFHIERSGQDRDEIKARYMTSYMCVLVAALDLHLRGDIICLRYC
jgi:hypothetical protein